VGIPEPVAGSVGVLLRAAPGEITAALAARGGTRVHGAVASIIADAQFVYSAHTDTTQTAGVAYACAAGLVRGNG
jgi:hypothetical protein